MNKAEEYDSPILGDFLNEISADQQEKTDKRMRLAARIDEAIKAKGWKKSDFARALNKRPSEITKWLSGTHNFNTDTLFDIEKVLGIDLVALSNSPKEQVIVYRFETSMLVKNTKSPTYTGISLEKQTGKFYSGYNTALYGKS
jgi:transcriptional regulator with XRE-family HTH domain